MKISETQHLIRPGLSNAGLAIVHAFRLQCPFPINSFVLLVVRISRPIQMEGLAVLDVVRIFRSDISSA